MKVKDLNGFEIEITNLADAIGQAKLFREFGHDPPAPCDTQLRQYWDDMYMRLMEISEKSDKTFKTEQDERK